MEHVDNYDDFSRYYQGCWIAKKKIEGEKTQVFYVSGTPGDNLVNLENVKGTRRHYPFAEVMESFQFSTPPLGMINIEVGVMYLEVIPFRQYKKGFTYGRLARLDHGLEELNITNNQIAEHAFNPVYYPLESCIEALAQGEKLAAACSPIFCLENGFSAENPLLWYRQSIIGELRKNVFVIGSEYAEYAGRLRPHLPDKFEVIIHESFGANKKNQR